MKRRTKRKEIRERENIEDVKKDRREESAKSHPNAETAEGNL